MTVRRRKKMKVMIPLASMGDIAFLLIIFFMVVSSFMKNKQQFDPAGSQYVQSVDAAQIAVTLDEDERLWIQGQEVTAAQIGAVVETLVEQHPHDTLVHVNVHKEHEWDVCRPVIEALSATGVKFVFTGIRAEN